MRTPLTFYGGKQQLAPQLLALLPPHRLYLEPFCGGAALLFAKAPAKRETLNDADEGIITFWRVLRERPEELAAAIYMSPYGRAEWKQSKADAIDDDLETARRLIINVDQSYGRTRRSWSSPTLGKAKGRWQPGCWQNLPDKIIDVAERLRGVGLECGDAIDMLPRWDKPDALIYVDPPYAGPLRRDPRGFKVDGGSELWARLIPALLELREARVVLSGYPCPEARALLLNGWRARPLVRRSNVGAKAGHTNGFAPEVAWLDPRTAAEL